MIILPIISTNVKELRQRIQSMLVCNPSQIFLVTTGHQYEILQKLSESINIRIFNVLRSPISSKHIQVCEAISSVETTIAVGNSKS